MSFELDGNTQFFAVARQAVTKEQVGTALVGADLQEVLGKYTDQPKGQRPNVTVTITDYSFWSSSKDADADAVAPFLDRFPGEPLGLFGYVPLAPSTTPPPSTDRPTTAAPTPSATETSNAGLGPDDPGYVYASDLVGDHHYRNLVLTDKSYDAALCQKWLKKRASDGVPVKNPYKCAPDVPLTVDFYTKRHEGAGWYKQKVWFLVDRCYKGKCTVDDAYKNLEVYDDEDWILVATMMDGSGYSVDLPIYVDEATYDRLGDSGSYKVKDKEELVDFVEFHTDDFEEVSQGD